jgi:hypothetical protein
MVHSAHPLLGYEIIATFHTQGITPIHQTAADIRRILEQELLSQISIFPRAQLIKTGILDGSLLQNLDIYFYGSGCTPAHVPMMTQLLTEALTPKTVEVHSDLMAAARSLCQREAGIACILGTGANSCLYNGEQIVQNTPALGYILGDEGSGSVLGRLFLNAIFKRPDLADVRDNFLVRKAYNLYDLADQCATQRRIATLFADRRDENSLWIRDGLMRLASNVLFLEDSHQQEMYHPRIGATQEPVFEALSDTERDAYLRLYNNYFYQRHSFFWGQQALHRLPAMMGDSRMLFCAEDLGMLPDCVEPVLDQLRILTLEIQQMPKQQGFEYAHLEANPIRSVCTIATHDMTPLRLWWQQQPERRQRYYVTMLQKEGRAPEQLPAHLAEEIIARHLYCPSMLCILQLQDWLAMDSELRSKHPDEERVNTPSDAYNRWQYRMHLTIEELLQATKFNNKLRTMIQRSRR